MHSVHMSAPSHDATRVGASAYLASAHSRRPGRVLVLALACAIATTTALGGAGELFNRLSGGKYAADIIRSAIPNV